MSGHEGPLKLWQASKKKWREGYGRVEGRELRITESVLGGEALGSASLSEPVKRGAPAEVSPPANEDNCQFSLGPLLLSAPSFAASSEWIGFLKSHNAAVQEARKQVLSSGPPAAAAQPAEPASLPEACSALVAATAGGSSDAVRAAKTVQAMAMGELKRAKSVLQAEARETAASRQLEAAVAELAGLLKELMGAIRLFAETEDAPERARVVQLARDAAEAHERVAEREAALKARTSPAAGGGGGGGGGGGVSPRDRTPTARSARGSASVKTPLDEACEELAKAARVGPKEAVAATKQVQALAMAQLRSAKAAADVSAAERSRVEPEVAAAASALKDLVGGVRVYARDAQEEQLRDVERLARALQERAAALTAVTAVGKGGSGALPSLSPRGPSLSMEQLMALADPSSSSSSAVEPELPARKSPRGVGPSDSLTALRGPVATASAPAVSSPSPSPSPVPADEGRDLSAGLRDPTHRLLASALQDAVRELGAWWRAGAEGGDDECSHRVRGALCSALAQVLAYRFKVGRGWLGSWGGPSHFWQFIEDFSALSSVNTVAGLSLQKCLRVLMADERAGHDHNSRFRSLVVVALNQGKLSRWLGELSDPGQSSPAVRFYEPGAMLLDLEARTVLLDMLRPLERHKWNMEVHYEWNLRELKKQQQQQQH